MQKFSTTQINRDFRLKVKGFAEDGRKLNTLVGVSGLIALIGIEFLNKFIARAYDSMADKCVCKLRRGLVVTFYAK